MGCFISHSDNDEEEVSQKKRKVVMVGLQNSGKTSILNFLIHNKFIVVAPTAGFNVENLIYENEKYIFFDVGGKVRSLWTCYYENLDGLIFVIDSNDK
jgi:ADP-ribosylation factor protein 1